VRPPWSWSARTSASVATAPGGLDLLRAAVPHLEVVAARALDGVVAKSSADPRGPGGLGDVERAERLLGLPYRVAGLVVRGDQRGRTIGFPTANVATDPRKALPIGVFAVAVDTPAGRFGGMANVGPRPTFPDGAPALEVHLFDADVDLYDRVVTVHLLRTCGRRGASTASTTCARSSPRRRDARGDPTAAQAPRRTPPAPDAGASVDSGMLIYGRHATLTALREGQVRASSWRTASSAPPAEFERAAARAGVPSRRSRASSSTRRCARPSTRGWRPRSPSSPTPNPTRPSSSPIARGERLLLVCLDHVTDPRNYGAIIRSAEALGAHGVVTEARRSAPLSPVVAKTAAGATAHLPLLQVTNLPRYLAELKERGVWVYGADAREGGATRGPREVDWDRDVALVIGAEGEGLRRIVRAACDELVALPLRGRTPSLNASVAAALLIHDGARWRATPPLTPRRATAARADDPRTPGGRPDGRQAQDPPPDRTRLRRRPALAPAPAGERPTRAVATVTDVVPGEDKEPPRYRSRLALVDLRRRRPGRAAAHAHLRRGDRAPRWSPDGRRIAFLRGGRDAAGAATPAQLAVLDLDGGEARVLTSGPNPCRRSPGRTTRTCWPSAAATAATRTSSAASAASSTGAATASTASASSPPRDRPRARRRRRRPQRKLATLPRRPTRSRGPGRPPRRLPRAERRRRARRGLERACGRAASAASGPTRPRTCSAGRSAATASPGRPTAAARVPGAERPRRAWAGRPRCGSPAAAAARRGA
jgi:23S rRNA (guanosine2251-2'-O)-methyltransferase